MSLQYVHTNRNYKNMKTIKELETEILKEQTKADGLGIYCQGSLTALKDVLGLIDEINPDPKGCLKSCNCVFCKLKKRITG